MKQIFDINEVITFLKDNDNYAILTHQYPDGDTLGSAYALCGLLQQMDKKAKVLINGGEIPSKFSYLANGVDTTEFTPQTYISVDVADRKLLGELDIYTDKITMAIDHHETHKPFAQQYYVVSESAANCENIFDIAKALNLMITKDIANALYTGITTDTGCFRYSNVTPRTHIIASQLMEYGCEAYKINKQMFETVSKNKKALEAFVIGNMEYYHNNEVAFAYTTKAILDKFDISEDQVEGISAIPRTIEGVKVGITFREKDSKTFKVSVRTNDGIKANEICGCFGGGGHPAAAGCAIEGTIQQVKDLLLPVVFKALENQL